MSAPPLFLLTGSAGRIGISLRRELSTAVSFRCLDIRPTAGVADAIVGDITRDQDVRNAMQGVDAVVHLAGNPSVTASWESVRDVNMIGTYNVFEAARRCGVRKVVFASTNHVTGYYEREGAVSSPEGPIRPDSVYGVSKAFGEALGRYYADAHGLSVVCLRIGSFLEDPQGQGARALGTWCSPRDLAQLVLLALTNDRVKFGIFYGVSANPRRPWDIGNPTVDPSDALKVLGYQPRDNAEIAMKGTA